MFVRDTLTATQTPAFKNYFKKTKGGWGGVVVVLGQMNICI